MQSFFDSLLRAFRRYRRWFAAIFAVVGLAAALSVVSSASAGGEPTVVAAHPIAGGTVLNASDLRVVRIPAEARPEGAFSEVSAVTGRPTLRDVSVRDLVQESDLLDGDLRSSPGTVKLPVHFSDGTAVSLLQPGQHIDIFGSAGSSDGFKLVASDITVLTVPHNQPSGPLSSSGAELVVLEVNPDQAASITAAASTASLSFALR